MPYQSRFFEQTLEVALDRELSSRCRLVRLDDFQTPYQLFSAIEKAYRPLDTLTVHRQKPNETTG